MMDYKIFPPVNNFLFSPLTIAIIGFLHTALAHLAVGGGFLLFIEERRGIKEGDSFSLSFLKKVSQKFLYIVIIFVSISGAGIWFEIGLISPFSTAYLVNTFLWIFAIEWVFFFLSITFLLLHYEYWGKIEDRLHLQLIRNYAISTFMTLFFINAILTFQLTPTKLKSSFNLFKAFFNRTFFPSLFSRSFLAVMIASLFLIFFVSFMEESSLKRIIARRYFKFLLYSFLLLIVSLILYGFQIPKTSMQNFEKISYLKGILFFSLFLLLIGLSISFFSCIVMQRLLKPHLALSSLLCVVISFGLLEWIREDLRLPYLIVQRSYGNDISVKKLKEYQDNGFLVLAPYFDNKEVKKDDKVQGELLFKRLCGNCHTLRGVNSLKKTFSNIDEQYAVSLVRKSSFFKAPMPPFAGGEKESELIGKYLKSKFKQENPKSGYDVFRARCATCHDYGRPNRDLKKSFNGLKEKKIEEIVENMDLFTESMPKWTGSDEEKAKLSRFLSGSEKEGSKK